MLIYLVCLICRRSNSPLFRIDNSKKYTPTIWLCPDCIPNVDNPIDFQFVLNNKNSEKECIYDWCNNYCLSNSEYCAIHVNITEIFQKQITAFISATHPVLGEDSPVQMMDQYTLEHIIEFLIEAEPYKQQIFNGTSAYQIFLLTRTPVLLPGLDF
jgi:hypothetical protein